MIERRSFEIPGFSGEIAERFAPPDLAAEIARLTDPGAATETLHWGRNYLYVVEIGYEDQRREVVVKQFRNQGWLKRWKRRVSGSKAEKSWRGALALGEAGVATPAPVALIESEEPEGPSFYVSERLSDFFEARYFFRALHAGHASREFPDFEAASLLAAFGRLARRLHDGGIQYRDLSIGNLLVSREPGPDGEPRVDLVDANRARLGRRLGVWGRTRDLCRLPVLEPEDRGAFLSAYWGEAPGRWRATLFAVSVSAFLARNRWKRAVRRPFQALRDKLKPRRAHVHIPAAEEGASVRDKIVWDPLTDQPHQHATRWERTRVRLADAGDHLRTLAAASFAMPRARRRYRELLAGLHSDEVEWGVAGLALRPHGPLERQLGTLEELGARHLLLRLHPWQDDHGEEEELARVLSERGYELGFALPQNRDLVRDAARWRAGVEELAERFTPYGRHFQIGQAINRSKWGVWSYGEYVELATAAIEILRRHDGVEILGPAVIDFEFHYLAGVLNLRASGLRFDVVTSLLYVDRRGAPENEQLGYDTRAKAALLRALAETARNAAPRAWVTEFNWPLWEGPHSPAGKSVSVDEEAQADFLVRYYLEVLGPGLVERAYWWRDYAKGYGLIDPSDGRARPSFHAMRTVLAKLGGATVVGPLETAAPARALRFRDRDGADLVVAWSTGGPAELELPGEIASALDRDGRPLAVTGTRVTASGSPAYYRLRG